MTMQTIAQLQGALDEATVSRDEWRSGLITLCQALVILSVTGVFLIACKLWAA